MACRGVPGAVPGGVCERMREGDADGVMRGIVLELYN